MIAFLFEVLKLLQKVVWLGEGSCWVFNVVQLDAYELAKCSANDLSLALIYIRQ